jgi:DNA-binding PadR family transcriptional regulator
MSATRVRPRQSAAACPCTGETLDKLLQPALLALLRGGPMHGYALLERIAAMPGFGGRKPDSSGVYRLLKSLESRGMIGATWDLSASGPAKKTSHITPAGRRCLARWVGTLTAYRDGITALLGIARRAARQE